MSGLLLTSLGFEEVLLSMRADLGAIAGPDDFGDFLPIPVVELEACVKDEIPRRNLLCS